MDNDEIEHDSEFAAMSRMSDEELYINYSDIIEKEIFKERTMIMLPEAKERLDDLIGTIKGLLGYDSISDYEIWTEPWMLNPTTILVYLETPSFGASPRAFWLFQRLVESIDSFISEAAPNGKIRCIFGMKDMQKEIK